MGLREPDILALVRKILPGGEALADDCGEVLSSQGGRLLVTTDLMEEGKHFSRDWHPPHLLGRKLLTVNLSDLDASGAAALGFTLTLALPGDLDEPWVIALLEGLAEVAHEQQIPVIGGDTVGRPQGIGLGVTAFGQAQRWLTRSGVQPGDGLFVDQPLGLSLRGLRKLQTGQRWDPADPDPDLFVHLDPCPNLGLGLRLAATPEVHACLDLSDGLSTDLCRLAEASGCTITLDPRLDPDEIQGGEDYARCFASSLAKPELEARFGRSFQQVGLAVENQGVPLMVMTGGRLQPMPDSGFDHFNP
jgi:thiamine-monophosphate kinase